MGEANSLNINFGIIFASILKKTANSAVVSIGSAAPLGSVAGILGAENITGRRKRVFYMKKVILSLFITIWLIAIGCTQTRTEVSRDPETPTQDIKETKTSEQPKEQPRTNSGTSSTVLQQREKEVGLNNEQRKTIAESYYETGYKFYLESKYNEAKEHFRKTLELAPEHKKAKQYLEEIIALEGGFVPGDVGTEVRSRINEISAVVQQITLEIQNHLNKGIRFYESEDYKNAEDEFKWVIQTVKWTPYPVELAPYQKQAEGYLERTYSKKKEKELALKRLQEIEAGKLIEKEEEKRREEYIKSIEMLFQQAHETFQNGKYNETIRICNKILEKSPTNELAARLKDIAFQVQRSQRNKEIAKSMREEWKKTYEEFQAKTVGLAGTVAFPDKETWQKIEQRGPKAIKQEKPISAIDKEVTLVLERRLSFPFREGAPLQQIIDYIKGQLTETGVNIITDQDVDANATVTYGVPIPTPIKNVLKEMLKPLDLSYMVKDGIIIIAKKQKVFEEQLETRTYDVLDLVIEIPNFNAPDIGLFVPQAGQSAAAPQARIVGDDLAKLIQENLGKTEGGFDGQVTTCAFQSPSLIIRHLPSIHKEVEQLLTGLRAAMDLVVTVEARFLEVNENFLQDVGVDVLGLSTAPVLPAALQQNALSGGAAFTGNTPGFYQLFYNNNESAVRGDLRARIEQIIGSDTLVSRFTSLVFSRTITPTASYTRSSPRLGAAAIQYILRAVEKEEKGKILYSPKVTVYNGQRGYIYMSDIFTYLRTYSMTMVQPGQVLPDPSPAVLAIGTILEVRPSISADLRYVTMELKPQIVTPVSPYVLPSLRTRTVKFTNPNYPPYAGTLAPISLMEFITYELPDIQYQTIQTNVIIPDGGTVLIGGYHTGQQLDYTSGVPFFSKIPIIGGLFSEKVKGSQSRILLILVKAQITAMSQEEKERF